MSMTIRLACAVVIGVISAEIDKRSLGPAFFLSMTAYTVGQFLGLSGEFP